MFFRSQDYFDLTRIGVFEGIKVEDDRSLMKNHHFLRDLLRFLLNW